MVIGHELQCERFAVSSAILDLFHVLLISYKSFPMTQYYTIVFDSISTQTTQLRTHCQRKG